MGSRFRNGCPGDRAWREQHGKFKNFEEVRKVPGLDAAKIGDKRGWISFE